MKLELAVFHLTYLRMVGLFNALFALGKLIVG